MIQTPFDAFLNAVSPTCPHLPVRKISAELRAIWKTGREAPYPKAWREGGLARALVAMGDHEAGRRAGPRPPLCLELPLY